MSATIGMSGKSPIKGSALFWRDCKGSIWQSFPFTYENEHALLYNRLNLAEAPDRAFMCCTVDLVCSEDWRA